MEAEAEPPEDPLARTGRPFGGMIKDIKKRFPLYVSDIKDGLNMQCVSVFVFIYFAALSPAITFGGLLSECHVVLHVRVRSSCLSLTTCNVHVRVHCTCVHVRVLVDIHADVLVRW